MAVQTQGFRPEGAGDDGTSVVQQTLRREVNERIRQLVAAGGPAEETLDAMCECVAYSCTAHVELTIGDYETVRRFPTRFLVKEGHVVSESERVVAEADGYVVVEKLGRGGLYAVRADPRRRSAASADRDTA